MGDVDGDKVSAERLWMAVRVWIFCWWEVTECDRLRSWIHLFIYKIRTIISLKIAKIKI